MDYLTNGVYNEITTDNKADIISNYINSLDVRPRSKDTYRKALKRFVLFAEGRSKPLTRQDILEYKNLLIANYSAPTVSAYLTAVKGFYNYLEAEKISPNIARGIKGAKNQRGFKKDALTIEQARNTIKRIDTKTINGKRNFAIINLLIHTGLRTIEVIRANIEDIRQESGEALLYIQGKGRDSKDDFVVLTESTLKPIREYLKARGEAKENEALFASNCNRCKGERMTTRSISRIAKNALKDAGIDSNRITAHSLRHTAITLSLLAGASIQEAKDLARHTNINTTMIYAHNINRVKNAPERKIDKLLAI
jgi:integrase/recombinase XerD